MADRVGDRGGGRVKAFEEEVPVRPPHRHGQAEHVVLAAATSRCPFAEHAHGNPVGDALHQAPVGEHRVAVSRVSALLVVGQQPAAAGRRDRHPVGVGAVQVDPHAERVGQVPGLVDPLRLRDEQQAIGQRPEDGGDFSLCSSNQARRRRCSGLIRVTSSGFLPGFLTALLRLAHG